jgi:hypothetical protein
LAEDFKKYLQPETVSRLASLDLIARLVVEGFITGLHRSPYHGFSVEFSEYRPYMSGDPLKNIDWKVLARTERYYETVRGRNQSQIVHFTRRIRFNGIQLGENFKISIRLLSFSGIGLSDANAAGCRGTRDIQRKASELSASEICNELSESASQGD